MENIENPNNFLEKLKSLKEKTNDVETSSNKAHVIMDADIAKDVKQELNLSNNKDLAILTEYLYLYSMNKDEKAKEKYKELENRLGIS